jgi:hypothetical protein
MQTILDTELGEFKTETETNLADLHEQLTRLSIGLKSSANPESIKKMIISFLKDTEENNIVKNLHIFLSEYLQNGDIPINIAIRKIDNTLNVVIKDIMQFNVYHILISKNEINALNSVRFCANFIGSIATCWAIFPKVVYVNLSLLLVSVSNRVLLQFRAVFS